MPNRLQHAQSPYLLQHKDNPVDWYPWGEEAFEKAQREDKPVFLSVGYSTCHWCHVMAHESFEDDAVAALMNGAFVSIKVDREERPDVDNLYMSVCQMMTGQGGWPLTILMTPDKRPFYAATYVPKQSRFGRLGMMELVPRIQQVWQGQREQVLQAAEQLTDTLRQAAEAAVPGPPLDADWLHLAYQQLAKRYDARHGGFGSAPKFPSPHHLLFLLRYGHRTGEEQARRMVTHTLDRMRLGGVFDHVGYGFHRYSTDASWLLPHFEKMLYDQAMLALAYTEAYQATGRAAYASVVREIFTYVLRDLAAPEGGFFAAEDADSEGREGKFYLWTIDEVRAVLDAPAAELAERAYSLETAGNFEEEASRQKTGENILFMKASLAELAKELAMPEDVLRERLDAARRQLFAHRATRERPGLDDKILTDWNGLMIAALARAAQVLDVPAYAEHAAHTAEFVLGTLRRDGRLLHRYRQGEAGLQASVDDYAFLIWGLVELYEATFDVAWLREALALNETFLQHYWDDEGGGFFFTPDDGEALLVRQKETYDGALPSGNSVALLNLLRLARLTERTELEDRADALGRFASPFVRQMPSGFTALLLGLDFAVGPAYEIVIAGEEDGEDTAALLAVLRSVYLPNKVVLLRPAGEPAPAVVAIAPFTEAHTPVEGAAAAYVCENYQCNRPVTDPGALRTLLAQTPANRR